MKSTIFIILSFILMIILSISCSEKNVQVKSTIIQNPLFGSWEMQSVHWITKDTTYSIHKTQAGLFMIDSLRYSTMWTPTEKPRTPFKVLSNPTDEELIDGFRSVVFNAGTHVYTDSTLTTTAIIAKVPGFESGIQYYRYKVENNQMELTMYDETYPNGDKPEWFGVYETKFVYSKVIE